MVGFDTFGGSRLTKFPQISSNLAHFGLLEGNMVISIPRNDSVRVIYIPRRIGGDGSVQNCIKIEIVQSTCSGYTKNEIGACMLAKLRLWLLY